MVKAALRGTTIRYNKLTECGSFLDMGYDHVYDIVLERHDGYISIIGVEIFVNLYYELTDNMAALKTDCIDYTVYEKNKPLWIYPEWYVHAVEQNYIYEIGGVGILETPNGEVELEDGDIIMRNTMGMLRHATQHHFYQMFET